MAPFFNLRIVINIVRYQTFGMIAVAWIVVQILLGGLSVWFGGRVFGGGAKAKGVWKYHRYACMWFFIDGYD